MQGMSPLTSRRIRRMWCELHYTFYIANRARTAKPKRLLSVRVVREEAEVPRN